MTDHSETCGNCKLKCMRYQSDSRFPRDDGLQYTKTWSVEKWVCAACGRREVRTNEQMTSYTEEQWGRGYEPSGGVEVVEQGRRAEPTEGKTMPSQCKHRKWGTCRLNGLQSCDSTWCPRLRFPPCVTEESDDIHDGGETPYGEDPLNDPQEMGDYEYRNEDELAE
jgi:hypothetical protein